MARWRAKRLTANGPAGALMSGLALLLVTTLSLTMMWGGLGWHQRGVAQRQRADRDARLRARLQSLVAGFVHSLYNHRQRDTWPGRRRRLRLYFHNLDWVTLGTRLAKVLGPLCGVLVLALVGRYCYDLCRQWGRRRLQRHERRLMHAWLEQTRLQREAEQQAFEREVSALEARRPAQPLGQLPTPRSRPRRRARANAESTDATLPCDAAAAGTGTTTQDNAAGGPGPAPGSGHPPAPQ
jgi:hypothetical protein